MFVIVKNGSNELNILYYKIQFSKSWAMWAAGCIDEYM
jgi:hypothetical protein